MVRPLYNKGRTIWYLGGGGPREFFLKIVCRHKSQKKTFVENVGRKKQFVVEIDEKYVDQKKHQMVTYIIGKAYDKKYLRLNIVGRWSPKKKDCFLSGGNKKVCKQQKLYPPLQISNGASLNSTYFRL